MTIGQNEGDPLAVKQLYHHHVVYQHPQVTKAHGSKVQSWSLNGVVPCQSTIPTLQPGPALFRDAVQQYPGKIYESNCGTTAGTGSWNGDIVGQ